MWGVVDLYGMTVKVTIVDRDERDDVVAIVLQFVRHEAPGGRRSIQRDPASLSRDDPAAPATTPVAEWLLFCFFLLYTITWGQC